MHEMFSDGNLIVKNAIKTKLGDAENKEIFRSIRDF